jgi:aspartate-semialdehyde dehydrogenase
MSAPNIAIVGATGLVGELLLELLEQRNFPVGELRLLASERSAGCSIEFRGNLVEVQVATPSSFTGIDLVFFAATGALSKTLAPAAVKAGATVIDKSNSWRMADGVPLIVPEINGQLIRRQPGILACPNCSTIGFVMALLPLHQLAGLKSVVVTTLQAASGAGREGVAELRAPVTGAVGATGATGAVELNPGSATAQIFPRRLADNVIPQCDDFIANGFTGEEMKLLHESRKILNLPGLEIHATCVRVPVETGHCASILAQTERDFELADLRRAYQDQPGLQLMGSEEKPDYPIPDDVASSDQVIIGRLRQDLHDPRRVWMWQAANNLRKGAATNAVQIAEAWLQS